MTLEEKYPKADLSRINNTMGKMQIYLENHESICVGVSGGSDSNIIVHIICKYFRQYLPKIHFVFENTGLEYKATIKHLEYMENEYQIHIDRVRGEPIPSVVKREGIPIVSKELSYHISCAMRGVPSSIKHLQRTKNDSPFAMSDKQRNLVKYIFKNNIKVSSKCCDLSKKKPHKAYLKSIKADLTISGERQSEGGQRATIHKSCFEDGKGKKVDKFMPLFYWNDDTKAYYKEKENIKYSDCYEVWGMKRTGCVGCPFNSKVGEDLKKIKMYEPQMYKACMNIFGESYKLMDEYKIHRKPILKDDYDE